MRAVRLLILLMGMLYAPAGHGQTLEGLFSKEDSLKPFSLDKFYGQILSNHPVVSQAKLMGEMARQELRYARGSFDPKLAASADHKQFDDKIYYTKVDGALTIPTWLPVNPKVGYQDHSGALLNSEERIPGQQQVYAGISIPLGKGLFTDERRTAVLLAQQLKSMAAADQVKIINKILLDAAKDYWHWFFSFYQYKLTKQNVSIAQEIMERTRLSAHQGEAAAADTIQARINLKSRQIELQEAALARLNAEIQLSNYLWSDNNEPIVLDKVNPVMTRLDSSIVNETQFDSLLANAADNHPELNSITAKIKQMELEKSMAREMLKPQLDLSYYALSQPTASQVLDLRNDYKLGVDFSIPLFLRKERSKVALAEAKITSARLQKLQLQREIASRIRMQYQQYKNTRSVIDQQHEVADLYSKLVSWEIMNLENGEGDLFKINLQQEKLIHAQVKVIKSHVELQKQKAMLFWEAGNSAKDVR